MSVQASDDLGIAKCYEQLRATVKNCTLLLERQKTLVQVFNKLKRCLKIFSVLLETNENIKALFYRGDGYGQHSSFTSGSINVSNFSGLTNVTPLTSVQMTKISCIIQLESIIFDLMNYLRRFDYAQLTEQTDIRRIAMKFCALISSLRSRNNLVELAANFQSLLSRISSDTELEENFDYSVLNSEKTGNGGSFSVGGTFSDDDASDFIAKFEEHFEFMKKNDFYVSEVSKAEKEFSKSFKKLKSTDFADVTKAVDSSQAISKLFFLCIAMLFKYSFNKDRKELVALVGPLNSFVEVSISDGQLNLAILEKALKYREMGTKYQNPAVVKFIGAFIEKDHLLVCMDYSSSKTLHEVIYGSHPINQRDAIMFGLQIVEAIKFAHDEMFPLGNISPKRIGVIESGNRVQLKLFDLIDDFAEEVDKTAFELRNIKEEKPSRGLDYARYLAPELLLPNESEAVLVTRRKRSFSGDIYSYAIVQWELVQRDIPYADAENILDLLDSVKRGFRPSAGIRLEDSQIEVFEYKDILMNLLDSCWNPAPSRRPSAARLLKKKSPLHSLVKKFK